MNIIIGEYSGFCRGVSNTIKRANMELDKDSNIYCLGEIVHNERVIEMLEDKVSELEQQKIMRKMLFVVLWVLIWMIITVLFYNYWV